MTYLIDKFTFKPSSERIEIEVTIKQWVEGVENKTIIQLSVKEYNMFENMKNIATITLTEDEFEKFITEVRNKVQKIKTLREIIKKELEKIP